MVIEKTSESFDNWRQYISSGIISPFFQPILSIEKKTIFGYESLGRISHANEIASLGEFFTAVDNSLDKKNFQYTNEFIDLQRKVDRKLRRVSLQKIAQDNNQNSKLFLNFSPSLMMAHLQNRDENGELPITFTIQIVKELGINPERIVIEITEDYIHKNIDHLRPLIEMYKDFGFLIAIDDLGSNSSNLDRIGIFEPDIIKVDMQMLRKSLLDRSYKEILYTISNLSESLGISLLFEGIERIDELNQALSFGARYVQGFLFSRATENLLELNSFKNDLDYLIHNFHKIKLEQIKQKVEWEWDMEKKIQSTLFELEFLDNGEIKHYEEIFKIDSNIVKFYATDVYGNQISPNYTIGTDNKICIEYENRFTSNWSWRPYFLNHLLESYKYQDKWIISQPYNDIEKNNLLRTFSKTFQNNLILFIDIKFE